MNTTEILPKIGFGTLQFGMYPEDIVQKKGLPEQSENEDDDGDKIYRYESLGIDLLCFDKEEDFKLTIIELNRKSNALLWSVEIFKLALEDINYLARKNGCDLIRVDGFSSALPQELYQIKPLSIDFYFDKCGALENISLGIFVDNFDHIEWPKM